MDSCRSFKANSYLASQKIPGIQTSLYSRDPDDSNPNCHSILLYSPSCDTLRAFVSFAVLFGPDVLLNTAAAPTP